MRTIVILILLTSLITANGAPSKKGLFLNRYDDVKLFCNADRYRLCKEANAFARQYFTKIFKTFPEADAIEFQARSMATDQTFAVVTTLYSVDRHMNETHDVEMEKGAAYKWKLRTIFTFQKQQGKWTLLGMDN